MRFCSYGVEWNPLLNDEGKPWTDTSGKKHYWNYLYFIPNFLPKKSRYFGYEAMEYDCVMHKSFGFWFFNISWCFE